MMEMNTNDDAQFEQFEDAYDYLQQLVKQLEGDMVPLDQLSTKVNEARKIAELCEKELRDTEDALKKDQA